METRAGDSRLRRGIPTVDFLRQARAPEWGGERDPAGQAPAAYSKSLASSSSPRLRRISG